MGPDGKILATGSDDGIVVLWEIRNQTLYQHHVLEVPSSIHKGQHFMACVNWNNNGTLLATNSSDGSVRIYSNKGETKYVFSSHLESVYALQFSPDGTYLLSVGSDRTALVWNVQAGDIIFKTPTHQTNTYLVDWLDSSIFAIGGEQRIHVYKLAGSPILLEGHTKEVNHIKWNLNGRVLGSCSDDFTLRIWSPFEDRKSTILLGHTQQVFTFAWNPGNSTQIFSGSSDFTVRIWDTTQAICLKILQKHTNVAYCLNPSPKGMFLSTGGLDKAFYIWKLSDYSLICSYEAKSDIYDIQWDKTGQKIAICLKDASVAILGTQNIFLFQE